MTNKQENRSSLNKLRHRELTYGKASVLDEVSSVSYESLEP